MYFTDRWNYYAVTTTCTVCLLVHCMDRHTKLQQVSKHVLLSCITLTSNRHLCTLWVCKLPTFHHISPWPHSHCPSPARLQTSSLNSDSEWVKIQLFIFIVLNSKTLQTGTLSWKHWLHCLVLRRRSQVHKVWQPCSSLHRLSCVFTTVMPCDDGLSLGDKECVCSVLRAFWRPHSVRCLL